MPVVEAPGIASFRERGEVTRSMSQFKAPHLEELLAGLLGTIRQACASPRQDE